MPREPSVAVLSRLGAGNQGVFRGREAVRAGVSRDQLTHLRATEVVERLLPDTYRLTAVAATHAQMLRAALLWAGDTAAATGRSAAEVYGLEGAVAPKPEIAVAPTERARSDAVVVCHAPLNAQMVRSIGGLRVTGPEFTLLRLAASLDDESFEIACEDARRRRLTTVPALRSHLMRHGRRGRPGVFAMRKLLDDLDPEHVARSTLEVKTRRLLVAHGICGFVREFPLEWEGRTYRYDFAFPAVKTILETNGRRWHDDPTDYEDDNEKWSVLGRCGYRVVFATWNKVTRQQRQLLRELTATLAAT